MTEVYETKYEGEEGKRYAVSANDKYGNETAPILSSYTEKEVIKEKSLQLNGINQYLEINSTELVNIHNSGEVTYQIKYFYNGIAGTILHRGSTGAYRNVDGCLYEPAIRTYQVSLSGCHETAKVVSFDSNLGWNDITVSISNNKDVVEVYLNGELIANRPISELINTSNRSEDIFNVNLSKIYLGAALGVKDMSVSPKDREPVPTHFLDGKISEVRIWNYGLSEEDVINYSQEELTGGESGLVGLWKFNEGSGDIVYDNASNNHAVIHNGGNWVEKEEFE